MNKLRSARKPEATGTAILILALTAVTTMKENEWPHASWWAEGSAGRSVYVVLSIITGVAALYVAIALRRLLSRRDRTRVLAEAAHGFAKVVAVRGLPELPEFDRVRRTCEAALGSDDGSGSDEG